MATNYLDNYYARLGISKTATLEDVRTAFRRAARQFHPDTNKHTESNELFLQVQEAFEVLSDSTKRSHYDAILPDDIDGPPALMVNALYSRSQVVPNSQIQNICVLLDLMATPGREQELSKKPPLNVCLILDTSTSMAGERLSQVLKAANQFVRQLQPYDILSVVAFNDRAEVLAPASAGHDNQRLISRMSTLKTGGGTEIYQGLKAGISQVGQQLNAAYSNHVVLITDGRTYGDEAESLALAGEAGDKGITISAVGIGDAWNENFIDALVSNTGGSSIYAASSTDIQQMIEKTLSNLNQTFANNVRLSYQPGPGSTLSYAFRLAPEPGNIGDESPLSAGNIPLGKRLSLLLEFQADSDLADKGEEFVLAAGDLRLDIPTQAIPATTARFQLSRPLAAADGTEAPPQVLVKAIGQLSLYRMQEESRAQIERGEPEAAAKGLRMLATHLLSMGDKGLARTALLAAEEIKAGKALDANSGKQIKYGTRALIQDPFEEMGAQ
ncbi:MAG: VWA domain-containing protein [Chloroflexi bacterium]|nr:VWA domain-containing protein [Chloroflexota bacterium]MQC26002.1 VWA domain-containing protein [Chloroflexota bacterium]